MRRNAQAVWRGGLKDGKGTLSTDSGVLKQVAYGFSKRFEDEPGTNPEELVAAAHAGCFSMAFSGKLGEAGITPESIETKGSITFEKKEAGWTLLESHLSVQVRAPGADRAAVEEAAQKAKEGCPISRALDMDIKMSLEIAT